MAALRRKWSFSSKASRGDVLEALKKSLSSDALEKARQEDGVLFSGPMEEQVGLQEDLLHQLVAKNPYVPKTTLAKGLLDFNEYHKGMLGGSGKTQAVMWARREACSLKACLMCVMVTARRCKTGERLSSPMKRIVGLLRQSSPVHPKPLGRMAVAQSRALKRRATEESATSSSGRAQIAALYGVSLDPSKGCEEVPSSPELISLSPEQPATGTRGSAGPPLTYWCEASAKVIRVHPSCEKETGNMVQGPAGFWVAEFSDGTSFDTEVPNLVALDAGGSSGGAACRRKPASVLSSSSRAQSSVAHPHEDGPPTVAISCGTLKRTLASKKSYIQLKGKEEGAKYALLVNVSENMTPEHQAIVKKMMPSLAAMREPSKEAARALRDELLATGQ